MSIPEYVFMHTDVSSHKLNQVIVASAFPIRTELYAIFICPPQFNILWMCWDFTSKKAVQNHLENVWEQLVNFEWHKYQNYDSMFNYRHWTLQN